jgi:hypothetical protein
MLAEELSLGLQCLFIIRHYGASDACTNSADRHRCRHCGQTRCGKRPEEKTRNGADDPDG